jgi:hypothetical protein
LEDTVAIKCMFPKCRTGELPVTKENVVEHLIVTKDEENHFHVHGPMSNKVLIQEMVIYILKEAGVAYNVVREPREEIAPEGDEKT